MASSELPIGLKVLLDQIDTTNLADNINGTDILAIHGLGMHPDDAWCETVEHAGGEVETINWLTHETMLPKVITKARIMRYGYESYFSGASASHHKVTALATRLLVALKLKRKQNTARPIVFIAHCFGGLVLLQALLEARDDATAWPGIFESTVGIVFLGTPFRGTDSIKQSEILEAACLGNPAQLMHQDAPKFYQSGNEFLQYMVDRFTAVSSDIDIRCFIELKATSICHPTRETQRVLLVTEVSGSLDPATNKAKYTLSRDHFTMTKFKDPQEEDFLTLCDVLKDMTVGVHSNQRRWNVWRSPSFPLNLTDEGTSTVGVRSDALDAYLRALRSCNQCADNIAEASEKTLAWIWHDPVFTKWLESGKEQLWITGKPGSGKSVLMKEISHNLSRHLAKQGHSLCVASHFFNKCGKPIEQSFQGMLSCLLGQILAQRPDILRTLARELRAAFGQTRDLRKTWSTRSLHAALRLILTETLGDSKIFLFVDGLDEGDKSVAYVLSFFSDLISRRNGQLWVCCSTRSTVASSLPSSHSLWSISMQERNAMDIVSYVEAEWAIAGGGNDTKADLEELKGAIIKRADGVWLWVRFVLEKLSQGLQDGNTSLELRQSLDEIPSQLSGLYDSMLEGIESDYTEEMTSILSIVLCAMSPLTLSELRFALALCHCNVDSRPENQAAVERSNAFVKTNATLIRRLRSRCGGLIETCLPRTLPVSGIDAEEVVQFMHQSVKDHLLSPTRTGSSNLPDAKALQALGHKLLTIAAINYLMLKDLDQVPNLLSSLSDLDDSQENVEIKEKFPFLEYASNQWPHHYFQTEQHGVPQWELLDGFYGRSGSAWETWCTMKNWQFYRRKHAKYESFMKNGIFNLEGLFQSDHHIASGLVFAIQCNFSDFVYRRLEAGEDPNDDFLLWVASYCGHTKIVELLVKYGAQVDHPMSITPLSAACMTGHKDVVKYLLDQGANTLQPSLFDPLGCAAISGRGDLIELLLEYDPETFMNAAIRHQALIHLLIAGMIRMAYASHSDLMLEDEDELMFDEKIITDENSPNTERAIAFLIKGGIDVRYFGSHMPWLLWFLTTGRQRFVQILLEQEVDLTVADSSGVTFFLIAAFAGSESVVTMLIDYDPTSVLVSSRIQTTVLHAAAGNTDGGVLRTLLLDHVLTESREKLDIDAQNLFGATPLHIAAAHTSNEHIKALIDAGADVLLLDGERRFPFHVAVGNPEMTDATGVLDALSPDESILNARAIYNLTPLHFAALSGNYLTVQWLLDRGADVEARDAHGRTALHHAAANPHDDTAAVLDILIRRGGLESFAEDDFGATPLHSVLVHKTFPQLEPKPILGAVMSDAMTGVRRQDAWKLAVALPVIQLKIKTLIANGADINCQDANGNTVLHWASVKSAPELIKFLLRECGADPNISDCRGCLPVDLARVDAVRKVLEAVS